MISTRSMIRGVRSPSFVSVVIFGFVCRDVDEFQCAYPLFSKMTFAEPPYKPEEGIQIDVAGAH